MKYYTRRTFGRDRRPASPSTDSNTHAVPANLPMGANEIQLLEVLFEIAWRATEPKAVDEVEKPKSKEGRVRRRRD